MITTKVKQMGEIDTTCAQ